MTLRIGSVCSGIEAASEAWSSLGWEAAWLSEIEKFPSAVLKHRHPGVPNLGDMTKLHEHEVFNGSDIDVFVGGTPCQSFSVAGLRKGLSDARGNLALTFCAIAHEKRPRWVIWENVPGVLSDKGNAFGCFLAGLSGASSELRAPFEGWSSAGVVSGPIYGLAWRVLDAQFFGVPQRRRRVFVVGYLGDWRRAAQVLLEPDGVRGNFAAGGEAWEDAAEDAGRCFTPSQHAAYKEGVGTIRANGGDLGGGSENLIAHTLRGEGFDASEDGTGRWIPLVPMAFGSKDHGADAGEICPALRAGGHADSHANAGVPPAVVIPIDMRQASRGETMTKSGRSGNPNSGSPGTGVGKAGDPCPTLGAMGHQPAVAVQRERERERERVVAKTLTAKAGTRMNGSDENFIVQSYSDGKTHPRKEIP